MTDKASLSHPGGTEEIEIVDAVKGNAGLDVNKLRASTGYVTLDYGFANTASTKSAVSYVDGELGELRYRGYPIEQLAERSSFLEVAYLLFHGELPTQQELDSFVADSRVGESAIGAEIGDAFDVDIGL